jgi:hypothetical protein
MKVELLVNLKVGDGRIVSAGSVFSDEKVPIPDFIMRRLKRGMARIISGSLPTPSPVEEVVVVEEEKPPIEEEKGGDVVEVEEDKSPPKKKVIKKKKSSGKKVKKLTSDK